MKRLTWNWLRVCFCKNVTIIRRKLHLNFEADTDFTCWGLVLCPVGIIRFKNGFKFEQGFRIGPYALGFEIRFNLGVK